jgi:WD40 repeat protein/serine/threonine protein kinase
MAELLAVKCPECGEALSIEESTLGHTTTCSSCQSEFTAKRDDADASSIPETGGPRTFGEDGVPTEWQIGDVLLDRYEVTGLLGEGGMGKVFKVHHRQWDTELAVKSPKPAYVADPRGIDTFERECETWVNLGLHPHIASCYYVRRMGGIPRIFAEYLDGDSLYAWVNSRHIYKGGPKKALERVLGIAIQIAWGLHHAHEHGVIHRDVKSANVLMTSQAIAKVTDFGLASARAKAEGIAAPTSASGLQTVGGMTPAYCSPEQALHKQLSRATDIWSWALCLLEMMVGGVRWPKGYHGREVLKRYLAHGPRYDYLPKMPPRMATLLLNCLSPEPSDRPDDMMVIAHELKEDYQELKDQPFPLPEPRNIEGHADTLNNRAVSLLDLGKHSEALKAWKEALDAAPQHVESTYNLEIIQWRTGKQTDAGILRLLEEIAAMNPGISLPWLLASQVLLERDDAAGVVALLGGKDGLARRDPSAAELLGTARERLDTAGGPVAVILGHMDGINEVQVSRNGRYALSGSYDNTVRLWDIGGAASAPTLGVDPQAAASGLAVLDAPLPDSNPPSPGSGGEATPAAGVRPPSTPPSFRSPDSDFVGMMLTPVGSPPPSSSVVGSDLAGTMTPPPVSPPLSSNAPGGDFVGMMMTPPVVPPSSPGEGKGEITWMMTPTPSGPASSSGWSDASMAGMTIAPSSTGSGPGTPTTSGTPGSPALSQNGACECVHVLEGHTGCVESVDIGLDGRLAISGSRDRTVRVWDLVKGRCLHVLKRHEQAVTAVRLSRDLKRAVSMGSDGLAVVWSVDHGSHQREFQTHKGGVNALGVNRDATVAVTACDDPILKVWDVESGKELGSLEGHTGPVTAVWLNSRGQHALSGSRDTTMRLWDITKGQCLRVFQGHTDTVYGCCMTPDGKFALSASADKTVRLWEINSARCLRTFTGHTDMVRSVGVSRELPVFVSGGRDRDLRVWRLGLQGESYSAPFALSKALRSEVAVTAENTFRQMLEETRHALAARDNVTAAARLRAARTQPGHRRRYEAMKEWVRLYLKLPKASLAGAWEVASVSAHEGPVNCVKMVPGRQWAMSAGADGVVRLWDLETGECLRTYTGHTRPVTWVGLTAGGKQVLTSSTDNTIRVWHLESGRCIRTFQEQAGAGEGVQFSPDGRLAASAGWDIKIWDVATGRPLRSLGSHGAQFFGVYWSHDGSHLLSGNSEGRVELWEVRTGECVKTLEGHGGPVLAVGLRPDDRVALSGSSHVLGKTGELRLWDLEAGKELRSLVGHTKAVNSACLSDDGQFALSGSVDGTMKLWHVDSGNCLYTFTKTGTSIRSVDLSSNGALVVAGSIDGSMTAWFLDWELRDQGPKDWDNGATPILDAFLSLHTPYDAPVPEAERPPDKRIVRALSRTGKPSWREEEVVQLFYRLGCAGYGYLDPQAVIATLQRMAKQRTRFMAFRLRR